MEEGQSLVIFCVEAAVQPLGTGVEPDILPDLHLLLGDQGIHIAPGLLRHQIRPQPAGPAGVVLIFIQGQHPNIGALMLIQVRHHHHVHGAVDTEGQGLRAADDLHLPAAQELALHIGPQFIGPSVIAGAA